MVTWYILCDPTLKGDLLVQWRNQWKQWGTKFKYWSGESIMRSKYGFGQWGYVKTEKEIPSYPGVHLMGWEWNDIWGSPSMWKQVNNGFIDKKNLYVLRNWYLPLFVRWRNVMCVYFYEVRMNHWKISKWENNKKWQRYSNV